MDADRRVGEVSAVTLHPLTVASIERQGRDDRGWRCGCEPRGDKWWPCDYHRGYDDALDKHRVLDADRDALRKRLRKVAMSAAPGDSWTDAVLDADDLLVVDLRCPTCDKTGEVTVHEGVGPLIDPCPTCHGSGRRDVRVVDAAEWERTKAVHDMACGWWTGDVRVVDTDLLRRMAVEVNASTPLYVEFSDAEWEQIEGWAK